jgi:hypothetical protein
MILDRKVTRGVKLALLHLNRGFLVMIAHDYFGVPIMLLGLVLPRVWALICIMPWLPTIVANVGWKFLWLGDLLLGLTVLKISRRLMLGRSHSPVTRCGWLGRTMHIFLDEVKFLARSISRSKVVLSCLLLLYLHHGILLRDSFVH